MAAVSHCMRVICVAGILLRPAVALLPTACPVLPFGTFPAAAELRAMSCIDPGTITGPINRIGSLVISDLTRISSNSASCDSPNGELKAKLPAGAGTLTAGPSTCELVALGFSKTTSGADAAVQLRLEFDKCTAGAPNTTVVLLDVAKVKDFMAPTSIFPFFKQICSVQTTTPAQSLAKETMGFIETMVGNDTCSGLSLKSYENVDRHACKMLCVADLNRFSSNPEALVNNVEVCRGFSFDTNVGATGNICKLYKGAAVNAVSNPAGQAGLYCWNLTATVSKYSESTPAPPTAEEVEKVADAMPLLKLDVTAKAKSASVSTYVSPSNTCFAPFSVVTLENLQYKTISINVKESEWAELLDLIPDPKRRLETSAGAAVAQVYVDRAVYGDGLAAGAGGAATAAPVACTPVPAPDSNGAVVFIVNLVLAIGCILTMVFGAFGCNHSGAMRAHAKVKALAAANAKVPLE